jgi:hypothetical protein
MGAAILEIGCGSFRGIVSYVLAIPAVIASVASPTQPRSGIRDP